MITELKKQIEAQKHLSTSPIYTPDKDWPGMWVIIHPHWFDQLMAIAEVGEDRGCCCPHPEDNGCVVCGLSSVDREHFGAIHEPTCPYSEEYKPCG